jgi:hypothetical protein
MMMKKDKVLFHASLVGAILVAVLLVVSCGGSGGGNNPAGQTGTVAVLLTDNPTSDLSAAIVTVTKIELLGDEHRATVFSGVKIIDLLDLDNETTLVAISNAPVGWFSKIRMTVSDIDLRDKEGNPVEKEVKLPGFIPRKKKGKIDLNPQGPFFVGPGEFITIKLDLDMEKSLKIHENKNKYIVRPVIIVDIIDGVPDEKRFLRVHGTVKSIDEENDTFVLCLDRKGRIFDSGDDDDRFEAEDADDYDDGDYDGERHICVTVFADKDPSFFSAALGGAEVGFGDLAREDTVTVIGKLRMKMDMDGYGEREHCGIQAIVVEIGNFLKLSGTIRSEVDMEVFDFALDPGQGIIANALGVQLQEGTRIFTTGGMEILNTAAITNGVRAEIDGILLLNESPALLNSVFILLGADTPAPPQNMLSGEIMNLNVGMRTFDIGADCVEVPMDALIIRVFENMMGYFSSEFIGLADLENGDLVDLHGGFETGDMPNCFIPDTIVYFDLPDGS